MAQKILDAEGNPIKRGDFELYSSDMIPAGTRQVSKSVDMDKRQLVIIGSDETRDRDGDIVSIDGWQLDNYLANPVFLWAHNYSSVPLGSTVQLIKRKRPNKYLQFTVQYPPKGVNPFADMILELYGMKIINASSVGFIPYKWEKIESKKDEDDDREFYMSRKFVKQELLELSGCPVPCNPSALQNAIKGFNVPKGINADKAVDYLMGKDIPEIGKKDDILAELDSMKKNIEFIDETQPKIHQVPDTIKAQDSEVDEEIHKTVASSSEDFTLEEGMEEISKDMAEKPFPNEHACRLQEPSKYDRFARKNCARKSDGKCLDIIYGVKDGKTEEQAYRYPKDVWSVASARSHCKSHEGSFEPAASASLESEKFFIVDQYIESRENDFIFRTECGYEVIIPKGIMPSSEDELSKSMKAEFDKVHEALNSLKAVNDNGVKESQEGQAKVANDTSSDDLYETILNPEGKQGVTHQSGNEDINSELARRNGQILTLTNELKSLVKALTKI